MASAVILLSFATHTSGVSSDVFRNLKSLMQCDNHHCLLALIGDYSIIVLSVLLCVEVSYLFYPVSLILLGSTAAIGSLEFITPGIKQSGLLTFYHRAVPAARIVAGLSEAGINAWIADGAHTSIDMGRRRVAQAVRLSLHYYNTADELETVFDALYRVIRRS